MAQPPLPLQEFVSLATVVTRFATALALARVLTLATVLFLDVLVGLLVLGLNLCWNGIIFSLG